MLDCIDASVRVCGSIGDSLARCGARAIQADCCRIAPPIRVRTRHDLSGCECECWLDHCPSLLC
jgi:hypothetical protein